MVRFEVQDSQIAGGLGEFREALDEVVGEVDALHPLRQKPHVFKQVVARPEHFEAGG